MMARLTQMAGNRCPWIAPDAAVWPSRVNLPAGRDLVLEVALALIRK